MKITFGSYPFREVFLLPLWQILDEIRFFFWIVALSKFEECIGCELWQHIWNDIEADTALICLLWFFAQQLWTLMYTDSISKWHGAWSIISKSYSSSRFFQFFPWFMGALDFFCWEVMPTISLWLPHVPDVFSQIGPWSWAKRLRWAFQGQKIRQAGGDVILN